MLVEFTSKSGGTVDMFEKAALELIKHMGRREAVPSAISAEDLPEALEKLEAALVQTEQVEEQKDAESVEDEEEDKEAPKPIGLSTRAYPLIALIKQTIKEKSFLMWDYK